MIQKLKYVFVFAILFSLQAAVAQTITGTVSDGTGTPLPGVNIVEKGTSNGVTSDFDGNYSITVSNSDAILIFSYLGYKSFEASVSGRGTINVSLEEDTQLLDEVVVTALGISREKKSLGYAVTEVESEQINTVKDYNVANSLVGKVAGLVVNQSGGVGSGSRIVLRGNNSITGNNQALIVVDGIPIDMSGTESGGSVYSSSVTGGGITDLNPEDIESVSVLKGPNAAALYGSRAASGVLLITTKKGSKGQGLGISFNSNVTLENPMFLPDYQNEYGQGTNGAPYPDLAGMGTASWGSRMDGSPQLYFTGQDKAYSAQPNNVEDYFETGEKLINSVSVDKGGDDYSMRFSYTNNYTTSIIPNSKLQSHNFNLRTLVDISDKLSFDGKATYFTQELNNRVNLGSEGVLGYVYYMPRSVDVNDLKTYQIANPSLYDPANGISDYDVISYSGSGKSIGNPYWIQYEDTNDQRRDRFIGFGKVNYEFTDWLSAFIRVGGDITNIRTENINPVGHHFNRYGRVEFRTDKFSEMNSDFLITATKDFSEKINVTANVGGNLSKRTSEGMGVVGSQFKIPTRALLANTNIQSSSHTPMQIKKVNSLYGSVSLGYDNFMYLDLTARNDWSSTLASNRRSFFYPSASFAMLLDRFVDPERNVVDMLKVRTSWAEVGNDTGVYQLYQTFAVPQQGYLGLTTLSAPDIKYNEDLKPESVNSLEFGAEGRFFDSRLYFDMSVYNIKTVDMIYDLPVAAATGYSKFKTNLGEVQNKGVEFLIGGMPIRTENFSWDVSLNFSKNKNTVNELIEGLDGTILNTTNSGNVAIAANVGGGIGDIYGTVWAKDEAGNRLVNAEGIPLASSERELLGNAQPDWVGGLTNTISYKNLSLRFLIDGRVGGEIYSVTSASLDGSGVSERTLQYREGGIVVDAINTDTGVANTESITAQEYWGAMSGIAENYVYEQTNVRLREFAFTYNFSRDLVQKIGLNSASLGVIGRNMFFFYKKAKDIDPDATLGTGLTGQGISINNVPTVRSLGLNLNLKL